MKAVLILVLALANAGCGYALAGRGSFLPDYIKVVGIPAIENRSTYLAVEQVLTQKIRDEFIGRGNKYTVVSEASGSDAVLTGEITGISAQAIGFNDQQFASRYLLVMTMRMQLTDARTSMVLWSNDAMTFREESELAQRGVTELDRTAFVDQERSSFDRIATDVARSVVTSILEAF
jgi:hypothetical protein